ncbi:outer membrane beta-barrel protein [Prosthecomicrobium hirschii]|uniref:outer membrane beta-barrel protein n=1 Tax=Prosthecodimorpha hirschii TaxID=665126 RepID=UPI002220DB74|nr:outer membrane beta-barrel protein [Prosthecomicrobium hirschii]MCW1843319.1 outer membrane beta-barrel protein [Prosthecomicrobium hirschii]
MLRRSVPVIWLLVGAAGSAAAQGAPPLRGSDGALPPGLQQLRSDTDPVAARTPAAGRPRGRESTAPAVRRAPLGGTNPPASTIDWLGPPIDPPGLVPADPLSAGSGAPGPSDARLAAPAAGGAALAPISGTGAYPAAAVPGSTRTDAAGPNATAANLAGAPLAGSTPSGVAGPGAQRGRDGRPAPTARSRDRRALTTGALTTGALRPATPAHATEPAPPADPVPPGLRRTDEDPLADTDEPYAQQGFRAGGFLLRPALEIGLGRTTNAAASTTGQPGAVLSFAPELRAASDWSRHALEFDLRGSYLAYPADRSLDQPSANLKAAGRVDLADGMRLDLKAGYAVSRQSSGSAENPSGTAVPSTATTVAGSAGFTRDAGLIFLTLRTDLESTRYSGGTLQGGGPIADAASRDNDRVIGALRTGFHLSPALTPYVEVQASRRSYGEPAAAKLRDADGRAVKAGAELDFGPILRGDLSVGWASESPAGPKLGDLTGATFDGSLIWSPTRLTRVTLTAKTAFEPTTLAGSPGSIARTVGVTVNQQFGRQMAAEAGLSATDRRYQGLPLEERSTTAKAGLTWSFNPNVQAFLRTQYDRFHSTTAGADYDVGTVTIGLRLQK